MQIHKSLLPGTCDWDVVSSPVMQNPDADSIVFICAASYILQRDSPSGTLYQQGQHLRRNGLERLQKMPAGQHLFPQTHTQAAGC